MLNFYSNRSYKHLKKYQKRPDCRRRRDGRVNQQITLLRMRDLTTTKKNTYKWEQHSPFEVHKLNMKHLYFFQFIYLLILQILLNINSLHNISCSSWIRKSILKTYSQKNKYSHLRFLRCILGILAEHEVRRKRHERLFTLIIVVFTALVLEAEPQVALHWDHWL